MQVRKQQFELDKEQQTGSKYEKEYIKAVYYHPCYLSYMQITSWETLVGLEEEQAGIKIAMRNLNKTESRLSREISINSDMQMTPPLWKKVKRN